VQLLVRNAFPQIAELCMARGVSFVEVDLRTGVTKEQSSNNEVGLCSRLVCFRSYPEESSS